VKRLVMHFAKQDSN